MHISYLMIHESSKKGSNFLCSHVTLSNYIETIRNITAVKHAAY